MTFLSLSLWAMVFVIVAAVAAFGFGLHWAKPIFAGLLVAHVSLLLAGLTQERKPPR